MAVRFVSLKCPECGAKIEIEEGHKQCFCTYCGTRILMVNENEYTFRTIDDAKVIQAETERLVRLKEMEAEETEKKRTRKAQRAKRILAVVLGILGIMLFCIGILLGSASGNSDSGLYGTGIAGMFLMFGAWSVWESADAQRKERK